MNKLILGIGGSSGAVYARLLLERLDMLKDQYEEVGIVMSRNARINWELEIEDKPVMSFGHKIYEMNDFNAPFASGSARFNTMIVCPCSMGTIGRIANGYSEDLLTRAADVILKERRKLILVPRESPLNLIHIENMRMLTLAGAIICPATPSFYSKPRSIEELCLTVVDRVLELAGFSIETFRWGK